MDARLRELERKAATGDPQAVRQLRIARLRAELESIPRKWLVAEGHLVHPQMSIDDGTHRVQIKSLHGATHLCRIVEPFNNYGLPIPHLVAPEPERYQKTRGSAPVQRIRGRALVKIEWLDLQGECELACESCWTALAEDEHSWKTLWRKQVALGKVIGLPYPVDPLAKERR